MRLRKVVEEKWGFSWNWIAATGIYCICTVFIPLILIFLIDSLIVRPILFMLIVLFSIRFYVKMRSPKLLSSSWLQLKYQIRVHRGEHIIPKHVVPLQFLKGLIPLEQAHPNGLIQFTNNRYGIMYMVFVPRRTGKELEMFIDMITKNIIDRIHDGQVLKLFEMQRYTHDTSIKNQVAVAMNDETKTPEQRAHLNSIYQELVLNTDIPTKRFIYAFVALGRYDGIEDAIAERDNLTPSLEDGFKLAGVGFNLLVVSDSIALAYRRCIK